MRIGVNLPGTELGAAPLAIRDFVQAIEGLGHDHIHRSTTFLGLTLPVARTGRDPATTTTSYTSPSFFSDTWRASPRESSWRLPS